MVTVGLVQIGEDFGGQYFFPFSVGTLQAYATSCLDKVEDFRFLPALYARQKIQDAVNTLSETEFVFFSCYLWNMQYSLALAAAIKEQHPHIQTVFGGPQIPYHTERLKVFHTHHPFVDFTCRGVGERPFTTILKAPERIREAQGINFLSKNRLICNPLPEPIHDLNDIPSPYLTGIFAPLLEQRTHKWAAMIETNRGCPFSCDYCTWGGGDSRRVRKYNLERVFQEIEWFGQNKIEFVFCCDANFGLFPERDLRIVEKVAACKESYGYPHAFSVQNTKNTTKTIFELQKRLHDYGLQKGVNLALQSMHTPTLKSIGRVNIAKEQYFDLQTLFKAEGIRTFSDLIIGLPEESYESFTDGISDIVAGGQHNRIQFINLVILENAKMAEPDYQIQYGLKTTHCKIVSHHTSVDQAMGPQEYQDLVTATQTLPTAEWKRLRIFCWMTSLAYFNKLLQIPLLLMMKSTGASLRSLIEPFLETENHPTFKAIRNRFEHQCLAILAGESEFIPSREHLGIYWPADEFIFIQLCKANILPTFYNEARSILQDLRARSHPKFSAAILDEALNINFRLLRQPKTAGSFESQYNTIEAYAAFLEGREATLQEAPACYRLPKHIPLSLDEWMREVVWFGSKQGAYLSSWEKASS